MKKFEKLFLEKSKEFVEQYDIDDANKEAIKSILKYFAGIDSKNYPLTKGLLIHGTIGSGKTLMFKIIQKLIKGMAINNSREVVAEFNIGGFEAIDGYIKTKTRVFDDIGQEYNGKYYGNETNVFQELIIRRYEQFQNNGQITHFTTNFGAKNHFITRYGERAYDRLREMCSSIILGDNNTSRRAKYNPVIKKENIVNELTKEEIDKKNNEAAIRFIHRIYDGEDLLNSMYIAAYDYLKRNKILLLSESLKEEISIRAEKMIMLERNKKFDKLSSDGNLSEARNFSKKMFDIKGDLVTYQKKIGVIDFIRIQKEMDFTIDEILIS